MIWFLTFLTGNWWTLVTIIGEDFTQWGIALGGDHIDLGSFYLPSGMMLTAFKVIKIIWTHALNGLSAWSPQSWFTFGWYFGATACFLYAFFKLIQSVIVAILQFKIHAAIAMLFVIASVWKGSAFLAGGVFGGIFSNAIRLMVLGFMTSLCIEFFSSTLWPTQPDYLTAATIAFAAWIWVWLFNQADAIAAGVINGGPSVDGSSMMNQTALTAALGAWGATAIARLGGPGSAALAQAGGGAAPAIGGGAGSGMQSLPSPFAGAGAGDKAMAEAGKHTAQALRANAGTMEGRANHNMDLANAKAGGDHEQTMYNSTVALGEKAVGYKNLFNEAANHLDGGGQQSFPLSHEATVSAEASRAAVVAGAGVGDDIRKMTADGKSSRQIAEALGERLSVIDTLSARNNETGETAFNRLAAVQAYKTAENIPNPSDGATFGQWQRDYRTKQAETSKQQETEARERRATIANTPALATPQSTYRKPNNLPYLQRHIPAAASGNANMRADFSTEE
jgi:type IV secretory pathway TrbL component